MFHFSRPLEQLEFVRTSNLPTKPGLIYHVSIAIFQGMSFHTLPRVCHSTPILTSTRRDSMDEHSQTDKHILIPIRPTPAYAPSTPRLSRVASPQAYRFVFFFLFCSRFISLFSQSSSHLGRSTRQTNTASRRPWSVQASNGLFFLFLRAG